MRRVFLSAGVAAWVAAAAVFGPLQAADQAPGAAPAAAAAGTADAHQAVVRRYCVTCHNPRTKSGGLVLDGLSLADVPAHERDAARRYAASRRRGVHRAHQLP